LPTISQNHKVTIVTHSAGVISALEALRLMAVTNPGAAKPTNLITMEAASFQNVFASAKPSLNGAAGTFDNLSHNNWFTPSLTSITGNYYNFYSADDTCLSFLLKANEDGLNANFTKSFGHARNSDDLLDLQQRERTAERMAGILPGIHSFGPINLSSACLIPHGTEPLGNVACPECSNNVDCAQGGFGILTLTPTESFPTGCHSYLREKNYFDVYETCRKIVTIAQ
jgi:hypothetical protein